MNTIATILYVVMGLCAIGVILLIIRLCSLWKQRDEIGESAFQRTLTFVGLLIGLAIVLGILAPILGAM